MPSNLLSLFSKLLKPSKPTPMETPEKNTWREAAQSLTVEPKVTKKALMEMKRNLFNQLELNLPDWKTVELRALRDIIINNFGARQEAFVDEVMRLQEQVLARKKKDAANHLTWRAMNIYMAAFRKEQNTDVGLTQYEWRTRRDSRVCSACKSLEGKIFDYNDPPIIDPETRRRGNPGENWLCPNDEGCRCNDLPQL